MAAAIEHIHATASLLVPEIVLLIRELAALYAEYTEGKPASLPRLAIQYGDYSAWQRESLQQEYIGRQLQYWTSELEGAPALLALPTDHPRPPIQSWRGDSVEVDAIGNLVISISGATR